MAKKKKTIDKLARDCKAAFEKIEADVASNESQDVSDEKARFNIWMDSVMPDTFFGISRLDYQLRDSEALRSKVRTLLTKLIRVLKQAREPETEEVDSVLSDQEVTDDLGSQRFSNQARQIQRARRVIDLLLRLTETVKRPAPDDQIKFDASNTAEAWNHDPDVEQVQAQFPGVPLYLAERLGKAIWKRRQYFVYKTGLKRGAIDDQEAPADEAVSNGISAGDGQIWTGSNDDLAQTGSIEDFATAPLGAEIELKPWREPEEGMPFSCPVCFDVFNPSDLDFWLDHIEDDLRAYLCTWQDCGTGPHMYARRKDWQRHEETVHRRTWKCPLACDSVFETAAAFSDHLHTSHEVDKDPEILKSLIEASSRPSEPSEVLRCPLCEARITTIDRFYRHVGEHLQYLSYFSLPAGLVRERPETDAESVDSASIRVEEESSEHADDTSQEDVAEQEKTGAKSRQAIVESDDAEHFSDKVPDAGALVAENELEIIVIEETPVEEPKDDGDHASQRQSTITRERARERSPARMDFAPESRTVPERSKSQDSVVEIPRNIDEHARWDREGFERLGPLKLTEEDQEGEEDFWGSFVSTKDKKKKKKKTEKKTSFDFGWSDKSAEPVNDVGPPPPLERSSIDKTEVVIRNRSPSPLPRERHGFKVKTISGQTEDIDDRVRRRTPTPSPPPTPPSGDRLVYREREGDRSRPAEREEFVFRTRHKSSSVSPPPQVREFRFDRDRLNTKSAKAKEDRTLDRDIQYREFVEKYEQQRAEAELERKELLARAGREYEEKKYKLERERKEVEERIQVELKKKEEEKKREEEKMAKMVHEKMWQRLTAFGFTDRQIRSIVKGDDKSERTKPGFEDGESLRERERDYYGPSLFPAKEPDYYAYSRDDSYPARDYRTGERVTSRPSRGHYVESEDDLEPIRFEDAEFRRYKLPFKVARTWKGVQKAIREIYQNSEVRDMDEDIISGRYQMLDADDNGILPSTWEMVVKPGHVYKLAFTRNVNHERPYDRHRDYDDELSYRTARLDKELNDLYEETRPRRSHSSVITQNEPVQGRQRRRSQSPPIIRESTKDLGVSLNVPPPPPQQNPFQPANAPNPFRPLEPQLQIDRSAGPSYHGDDEFDFHRRPRRNRSTKAVSFDPYIDDEPGWYPSLETATRGGFRRPEREASHRSRYGDEFHPAASYAYPPPPPRRNNSIQHRRPTWMKAHRDHIDPETLRYYDLPWEYDTNDPDYILIRRDMEPRETEILFEHTRRLKSRPTVTAGPSGSNRVETVGSPRIETIESSA